MNIYTIDIPGGYSGTVEVSEGSLKIELPTATGGSKIKRYNIHLLFPDRKNYEFDLLRFPDGEWCNYRHMQLRPGSRMSKELETAVKKEISKMKI